MTQTNWQAQSTNYGGQLIFPSVRDWRVNTTYPSVTLPLYIKEMAVPTRKPKLSEINTGSSVTRGQAAVAGTFAIFYGAPEPLSVQLSGFFFTPMINSRWDLSTRYGINIQDITLPELILAYVEGRMARNSSGVGTRIDPSSYTDPYGNIYTNPTIMSFDASFTPVRKKQTFNMQLWLEE